MLNMMTNAIKIVSLFANQLVSVIQKYSPRRCSISLSTKNEVPWFISLSMTNRMGFVADEVDPAIAEMPVIQKIFPD